MSNRDALRELQARLSSRLEAAKGEGMSISWLATRAGGENYLFPLAQSGEIFPFVSVQAVPFSATWFLGVVNLRGGLFGVVNLAGFVAIGQAVQPKFLLQSDASLITLNSALEVNCALYVDGLAGLRNRESFAETVSVPDGSPSWFGSRFVDSGGEHWQEINLQLMSKTPQFLNVSASF